MVNLQEVALPLGLLNIELDFTIMELKGLSTVVNRWFSSRDDFALQSTLRHF